MDERLNPSDQKVHIILILIILSFQNFITVKN